MRFKIKYLAFLLILLGCKATGKKIIVDKYSNGNPKVIYIIYDGTQTDLIKADYICLYENGDTLKKGMIINNKENGEWRYYYPHGIVSSKGFFSDGKRVGKAVRFYETGQVEQECEYNNNQIINMKFYYRNGKPKPQNVDLSYLLKDKSMLWDKTQLDKINSRLYYNLIFDYKSPDQFCNCITDSLSKHIDFATVDTLTDYERGFLIGILIQKGVCKDLLK